MCVEHPIMWWSMRGTSNQSPREALGEADPAFLVDDRGRTEISGIAMKLGFVGAEARI